MQLCAQIDIDASLTQWADQPQGRTLLHWCALFDLGKEVDLLLSRGADATVCDGSGRQPWELAEGALADRLLAAVRQAGLPAKTADAPADCAKHRNDSARQASSCSARPPSLSSMAPTDKRRHKRATSR